MKKLSILIVILLLNSSFLFSQVSINADRSEPDPSAMLDVKSSDRGVLIPRISTIDRNQIPSPATGLMIYNTTTNQFNFYNGSYWYQIGSSFISSTIGTLSLEGGVSINVLPDAKPENSAMLDVNNPTRGVLIPRTTPELITAPATGLIIYNTAQNFLSYYDGAQWITLCAVSTGIAGADGSQEVIGVANKTDNSLPHHSAMLDVSATDKGVLIPRLTNAQRDILLPATGLVIYNTSSNRIEFFNGSAWHQLITTCFGFPVVTTSVPSVIMASYVTGGGTVTSDGGDSIIARGVCWSKSPNPTIADSISSDSTGLGNFISHLNKLTGNTTYHIRAYATNSVGTAYGNDVSFETTSFNIVCGTDSLTLMAEYNDSIGVIEWQESIDSVNWATIPETVGETFTFFPTQTKYYRPIIISSTEEPLPLVTTLVQLPPIANAGVDRTIGGTVMTLMGNQLPGATGEWLVVSGNSGVISEPENSYAQFTGIYNEDYQLVWTLTNSCGQSSDTVVIRFEEIVSKDNFIVVDNTDSIMSDSTEIANGIYKIKFSDPNISPADSVVLIGMRQDISFLRKVDSFTLQDSVYTFVTEQGTFQDLFKSGVINIGDAVNQSMSSTSSLYKVQSVTTFPTRKTLEQFKNSKDIQLLYVSQTNANGLQKLKSAASGTDETAFTLRMDDQTLLKNDDESFTFSIKDAYIKVTPRFLLDFKFEWFVKLTDLRIGVDNAEFEFNMATEMVCSKALSCSPKKSLNVINHHIYFTVGLIPVDVLVTFNINATSDFYFGGAIKYEQTKNIKQNLTAIAEGDRQNNFHLNLNTPSPIITNKENFSTKAEINAEVKIGPKISFLVYGIAGPYLEIKAKLNASACINNNLNWDINAGVGFEGNLGASGDIIIKKSWYNPEMSLKLFDINYPLFSNAFSKSIKLPYKLELLSGNFQSGTSGTELSKPISLKVVSDWGFGVPFVPVRFETGNGNGTLSESVLFTDSKGEVATNWTLGSNPQNKLKISVLDCNDNDIENSPVYVYASSTSQTYDCTNSSLSIDMKTVTGYMSPSVTGGTAPYTYSTNETDYSSTKPQFNILVPIKQTLFVKDKNLCIRSKTFEIKVVDACASSTLSMDVLVQPDILSITGKGGKTPYQFAVDNTASFTTTSTYYKLSAGKHTVYIKDANGCMVSHDVVIDNSTTTAAIRSSYPAQGATSIPLSPNTFQWVAANYATNQLYDLSLKKGNDAYSLLASNLSSASYTYTTALVASTTYTWKLAVKSSGGVVLDYREFTFTTASGAATTPTVPVLIQPVNGAANVWLPITFKWTAQAGDFKYDLYLDETNATRLVASNLINAEYTVNTLVSGKTYYWKVKIKSTVTGERATSAVWSFTVPQTVTDIDGNVYHTVTIGTQVWMVENLKTTRYNDGTSIPNVAGNTAWGALTTGGYCWYNNDISNKTPYGALYNWYTVNTGKLATTGWHVPTDAEWITLTDFLTNNGYGYGGSGSDIAKSMAAPSGWNVYSTPGTPGNDMASNNSSSFTALPGGYRNINGTFDYIGDDGFWWSWPNGTSSVWNRGVYYNGINIYRDNSSDKRKGFSVRCINNVTIPIISTNAVTDVNLTSAICGGNVTGNGGAIITSRGVCWSTSQNPTTTNSKTTNDSGTGSFTSNLTGLTTNTHYHIRAYATNSAGTGYGPEYIFKTYTGTVMDIDGNVYHTVTIGTQVWMVENLKTTRYNDGTIIPNVISNSSWASLTTGAHCWYNNSISYKNPYGALYNWFAVNTGKLAPTGWHVPTDAEWQTLTEYITSNIGLGTGSGTAKSMSATSGWNASTTFGTPGNDPASNNSSGFTALPGGSRFNPYTYSYIGDYVSWWNSNEYDTDIAPNWGLGYDASFVIHGDLPKKSGFHVRCVRNY